MKPYVLNSHGRIVLPSNFFPELDFTVLGSLEQLDAVITRDFEAKAPTGTDILTRVQSGAYGTRYDLLRDVALNLLWVNRYAITMYEKRPMRWRDVPRRREDVFLPVLTPWEEARARSQRWPMRTSASSRVGPRRRGTRVRLALRGVLPAPVPRHRAACRQADRGRDAGRPRCPDAVPRCPRSRLPNILPREIQDCSEEEPELEALHRLAMVLHNQYPWDRAQARLQRGRHPGRRRRRGPVHASHPRRRGVPPSRPARSPARPRTRSSHGEPRRPSRPYPPVVVGRQFEVLPRLESLSVVRGEHVCTNEDLIRNAAYNWSPMTAQDIRRKTGIEARRYTQRGLHEIALEAADAALHHAGRAAEEIGAVIFCSCTSTALIPSVATWISGQLGMLQTHASFDLVAACAGFPYGLAEAARLLQEVQRPVLVVCAEKFSDKIGTVRTSRMIFGDGAGAIVVAPADGADSDVEVLQTYASGPVSEVNSIIWPNPEFDNNITVYGPEVRALAGRYLLQMIDELRELPHPDDDTRTLLDAIELVVPHQANETMVTELAGGPA